MKEIQKKELERCIKFIEAIGCKYKIVTDDGESFGSLETKERKSRSPLKHPYGALAASIRAVLNFDAAIGDVQELKVGEYDKAIFRSGVCSELTRKWGKDTYTTNINGDVVEVLRVSA